MDLKSGDIVKLNSGSPSMTIESIGTYRGVKKARCVWFDGAKKCENLFTLESLKKEDE